MKRSITTIYLGLAALLAIAGCDQLAGILGNTGGQTEVVSQFLPDNITLDISDLPDTSSTTAKTRNADMTITGTTAYQRALGTAGKVVDGFQQAAARGLALAAGINADMTSADQTQVSGEFTANGQTVSYRADFSAFDSDGDDIPEGSGNAMETPIAIRMWVDRGNGFERFMAGMITAIPNGERLGAGTLYVNPSAARSSEYEDLFLAFNWDLTDNTHLWTEAFVSGQLAESYNLEAGHMRVDFRLLDNDTYGKTVRATATFTESQYGFNVFSVSTHFQREVGELAAALIDAQASGGIAQLNFDEKCVVLEDGVPTESNDACTGFDTQDMDFLEAAESGEPTWPMNFPEEPTFDPTETTSTTDQA